MRPMNIHTSIPCTLVLLSLVTAHAGTNDATPAPEAGQQGVPASTARSNGSVLADPGRYDLGDIEPGSEHSREFLLRNLTQAPVRVKAAIPTCRCTTTTDISGNVIPAGGTLPFTAILTAPTTPGVKNAKVQITFDGNARPLVLEIEGDVTMPIKATPPYVGGPKGDQMSGLVTIRSIDRRPFRVLASGGAPPVFPQGVASAQPRDSYTLRWDIARIRDLPRHIWWVVFTDHPDCPVLPLRIRNAATGSRADMERYERHWRFDESLVNAQRIAPGESVTLELVIKHYNPRARGAVQKPSWGVVKSLRSRSTDLDLRLVGSSPSSAEEVRVTFTATPAPGRTGPLEALLELETETGSATCQFLALVGEPASE